MELSDQDTPPDESSNSQQYHVQHASPKHSRLIQPLPIPAVPPPPPRGRSQSVDTGIIRAHANSYRWQALLEPEEPTTRSEPYYNSTDSLANLASSLCATPSLPSPAQPAPGSGATAKVSCESILESIDENRPSENFPRATGQPPHAKRRYSDHHSPLFSLTKPNVYPEKRQSEPTIRCAFYNKGFDALCPRQPPKRVLSQNDLPRAGRVLRRQISTICELNLADGSPALDEDWRLTEMPKFRYCISDESGHCIDFDTVLPSGGPAEIDDEDILRDALCFEENFVEKCAQICPESDSLSLESIENRVLDELTTSNGFGKAVDGGGGKVGMADKIAPLDDEIIYENVKLCRKCGHQRIKL